jgi:hypothetical protein
MDDTRYKSCRQSLMIFRVNDIAEPVLIQAFIAKSSVKALNKSVLRWLARLD